MSTEELVVGIDLGTTFSEIAAFSEGKVCVLGKGDKMLPSCVGLTPDGRLVVGQVARNQQALYPERTIRSIKRKMGREGKVRMGDQELTPQEVSALILKELCAWAETALGRPARKAVLTVPAYFTDAQRSATREAGELAGLEVLRILHEPTAAALAYGLGSSKRQTVMVYDLGGGTFDVSIVIIEGDITEVLASAGDTALGGDDFTDLLAAHLFDEFKKECDADVSQEGNPALFARLWWAAEQAKRRLSSEPFVAVREDNLLKTGKRPLHLDIEVSRSGYEQMISPLVTKTLASVSKALDDAGKRVADIDAVVLVGGSSRTPLVSEILERKLGVTPVLSVEPDLCVAMGAGVLASRLAGHEIERILVDVSPYTFGVSFLGDFRGELDYPYCFQPIIKRNTPLPCSRTELFYTAYPYQEALHVRIFQGDDPDALNNIPVGDFRIAGLTKAREQVPVLKRMTLNVDGILEVEAIEKNTGKSKQISVSGALRRLSEEELAQARSKLDELRATMSGAVDIESLAEDEQFLEEEEGPSADVQSDESTHAPAPATGSPQSAFLLDQSVMDKARALVARSQRLLPSMHPDDREEALNLHDKILGALLGHDAGTLDTASQSLSELLFFIEGR